jgi:RNA recognition motif-containing protein
MAPLPGARLVHRFSPLDSNHDSWAARSQRKEASVASKSLYVGNLTYSVDEQALRDLFAEFEPGEVRMIADKGFAFVDVPEEKAADAIEALNGREVQGRNINVNEARPRAERGGGGGGRGRSGGGSFGGGGGRGRSGGGGRRW